MEEHAAHVHVVSAWADLMALTARRLLPSGVVAAAPDEDPQETLFVLADGVLSHLSSPSPHPAAAAAAAAGSFDGEDMGGGAGWWDAREGALARLAATRVTRL